MSIALADLNEITRRGMLKGLGDIDMLQVCDVCRQYKQQAGYVLLGQTLDQGLAEVLRKRHVFSVSAGVEGGHPNREQQIENMLQLMFSKPFSREEARSKEIRSKAKSFLEELSRVCTSTREAT